MRNEARSALKDPEELHVVFVRSVEYQSGEESQTVAFLIGELEDLLLFSSSWDSKFKVHQVCFSIPKKQIRELKTICLLERT